MEQWKEIDNTNGDYLISNYGNIKSRRIGKGIKEFKIINPYKEKNGYKDVYIKFNNELKRRKVAIHRLVATYFIPKPGTNDKLEVNHIDSDRTNNHYNNLEWVTSSGNTEHAVEHNKLIPWNNRRKPIKAINIKNGKVKEYISISKAELEFNSRHIVDVLKGKRNQVKGYRFEYIKGGDANVPRFINNRKTR